MIVIKKEKEGILCEADAFYTVQCNFRPFMHVIVACLKVPFSKKLKSTLFFVYFCAFLTFFCLFSPFSTLFYPILKNLSCYIYALEYELQCYYYLCILYINNLVVYI